MTSVRLGLLGVVAMAVSAGCARSHDTAPAAGGTASESGGSSGAGGKAGSGGRAGASGGAGVGGIDTVADFNAARWAAFCRSIFECTVEGDGADALRLLLGSAAHCQEVLGESVVGTFGLDDLTEAVDEGRVVFETERVSACLEATAGCQHWVNPQPADAACRSVFEGMQGVGDACYRDEECTGAARCVVTDACPGTCTPRAAIGEACANDDDCDDSTALVACDYRTSTPICAAVQVLSPAGEGEACRGFVSGDLDLQPCADGMWCDGDGVYAASDPETPSEERRGICRRSPIPAGGACDDGDDVCEDGTSCRDEISCKPILVVREPGGVCDETHGCDPFERLTCTDGLCQSTGDGNAGSACRFFDWSAYRTCQPGLVCTYTGTDDPITAATPRQCLPPRATGEACERDHECTSQTCGSDGLCATRFCASARLQF